MWRSGVVVWNAREWRWALCMCVDVYQVHQRAASRYKGRPQENLPEHHPGSPRYQQLACVETNVVLRLLPAHCRSGIAECRCIASLIYALSNNSQTVIIIITRLVTHVKSFTKWRIVSAGGHESAKVSSVVKFSLYQSLESCKTGEVRDYV